MENIYEVVRIEQVVNMVEEDTVDNHATSTEQCADISTRFIGLDDREVFLVSGSSNRRVIAIHRAHVGSLNSSIIHPREVFKAAILNNSACVVFAHQHPSGSLTPSQADLKVTKNLVVAGEILGIPVRDHIIVNYQGEYYSIVEHGDII